ncbi:hypothetical protein WG922_21450 [Ramlibacter sp. AN1015]|uniref:hypothetical protein n=1 Tax=Ramlibacter sp. AN1015 TaxID=3133428 RepID=UPI0030C4A411
MTDGTREELIRVRAALIDECHNKASAYDDFHEFWMLQARSHFHCMRELILGRSAAYVRSLEIQRGLV